MPGFAVTLAYSYLAFALMLSQANSFCERLSLPRPHEYGFEDILNTSHNGPPKTNDFSGSLLTEDYFFGFQYGHLAHFYKRAYRSQSDAEVKRQNLELSQHKSLIDTNAAVEMATKWLALTGVNLQKLQADFQIQVKQRSFLPPFQSTNGFPPPGQQASVLLPVFSIEWTGSFTRQGRFHLHGPVAKVTVSGGNKEMLEYDVFTDELFLVPPLRIKSLNEVMNISDSEFQGLSDQQRKDLLAKHIDTQAK